MNSATMNNTTRVADSNDGGIFIHWVVDAGWLHTHGLDELGYPELEVRGIPNYLAESAADLIRQVYGYMVENEIRIQDGETMSVSPRTYFRLVAAQPVAGDEDHYKVERLQIVDAPAVCESCGAVCSCGG